MTSLLAARRERRLAGLALAIGRERVVEITRSREGWPLPAHVETRERVIAARALERENRSRPT